MNLAVADLLTLLLCPGLYDFALTKVRLQGLTGDLICKLFAGNAVVPITINVAVLTVCTIAVERYLALVKPFRTGLRITEEGVVRVIATLWFVALLSCIPDVLANTHVETVYSQYPCKRPWSLDEYSLHKPFITFSCVSREMRFAKDSRGMARFKPAEWRTAKQISSLFSRLAAKQRKKPSDQSKESDEEGQTDNDEDAEDWDFKRGSLGTDEAVGV
ncbi:hypothetical protein ACROYT_G003019 [Oculina patagonica]